MLKEAIKHFESLQKRYTTQHNGKQCEYVKIALEAMRKMSPQKILRIHWDRYGFECLCPKCNRIVGWEFGPHLKFCDRCGQALDWSEES